MVAAGVGFQIESIISIPEGSREQTLWLFAGTAISFILTAIGTPFSVAAFCRNRFEIIHGIGLVRNIVRVVAILVLFWFYETSVRSFAIALVFSSLVEIVCVMWSARRLLPDLEWSITDVDWETFVGLSTTGWWVSVFQVGTILLLSIDLLVVNRVFGVEEGGRYAIPLQWSALLRNFATSLAAVFSPTIIAWFSHS